MPSNGGSGPTDGDKRARKTAESYDLPGRDPLADVDHGGETGRMMARRKRRLGLFDLIMLLIVVAVVWLFLGQAGVVPPLPIGS